jgi:hypothetical protein
MADLPSDTVLQRITPRALDLVGAASRNRGIRAALQTRGYTQAVHEKGWELALKAAGYRRPTPAVLERPEAADALAKIDAWDEPTFRIAKAALAEFPDQQAFVFQDLSAQTGVASVASVSTFLDRLDTLESGEGRAATVAADQAALAKLALRGIDAKERAKTRGYLAVVSGPSSEAAELPSAEDDEAAAAELREARLAVWRWYSEWSEIAKAVIKRRDWLIQLGLAQRKTTKKPK